MGFYHPATILKDAQRHGLLVNAIDVTRAEWNWHWSLTQAQS